MRTIEQTVYQFAELDEQAKERAREWYRSGDSFSDFGTDFIFEDAVTFASILGIEIDHRLVKNMGGTFTKRPDIFFSGFWSQGDGASFTGRYQYAKNATAKIKEYAPQDAELLRIARELQALQKRNFYGLRAQISTSGRYSHSGSMRASVANRNGNDASAETEKDLLTCFRDFADWIYKQLEQEYDYQNSDDVVDESIICNEYEFTEEGERYV